MNSNHMHFKTVVFLNRMPQDGRMQVKTSLAHACANTGVCRNLLIGRTALRNIYTCTYMMIIRSLLLT